MADTVGTATKMGIKDVAGWTTAYAAVDALVPFDSESLTQNFSRLADDSLVGSAGRAPSVQGVQAVTGQTVHRLDRNNFDELFEMLFGAVAARVFTLTDDNLLKYCWLEFEKLQSRWRFGACKATKLTLAGEKDGLVMLTVDWIARDVDKSATAFPAISTPGTRDLIRFEDLTARFETIAAGPPAASDEKLLESFELTIDRGLVADDYASKDGTGAEKFPLEPIPNQFREVQLKVKLPRYASDADFITWKESDTPIQATFDFNGLLLELPDLRVTEGFDPSITGPERLQLEGTLDVFKPESTNPLYTGNEVRATFS